MTLKLWTLEVDPEGSTTMTGWMPGDMPLGTENTMTVPSGDTYRIEAYGPYMPSKRTVDDVVNPEPYKTTDVRLLF